MMRGLDELRAPTVARAEGHVLEIGFGTGLNLPHYGPGVESLVALEPKLAAGYAPTEARIAAAPFPVERARLRADAGLPFDAGRFDCVVSTWTLCSIPDLERALAELRRVLRPGGSFVFVEHGRAESERTARWQDRLNPLWVRIADGCHMNRPIDRLVEAGGFRLVALERFRDEGPGLLGQMYRGVAEPVA
jgi:SAM-dependent methyltransferase